MKKIKMLVAALVIAVCAFGMTACAPTSLMSKYLNIEKRTLGFQIMSDGNMMLYNRVTTTPENWPDYEYEQSTDVVIDRDWEDRLSDIKYVEVRAGVGSIGDNSFRGATNLTSIKIGPDVSYIGVNAFYGCNKLTQVVLDPANKYFSTVNGCLIEKSSGRLIRAITSGDLKVDSSVVQMEAGAFSGLNGLTGVDFSGSNVTEIPYEAFRGCSSLKTVKLGTAVTSIDDLAFFKCSSLIDVDLEDATSLKSIGNTTFYGCSSLKKIILPESLTSIGNQAFGNCSSLKEIRVLGVNSKISIKNIAFYNANAIEKIYVSNLGLLQGAKQPHSNGYLFATGYNTSYQGDGGVVKRNVSVYVPVDLYALYTTVAESDTTKVGKYIFDGEQYTQMDNVTEDGIEYVVFTAKK